MTTDHTKQTVDMTFSPKHGESVEVFDARIDGWRPAVVLSTPEKEGHVYVVRLEDDFVETENGREARMLEVTYFNMRRPSDIDASTVRIRRYAPATKVVRHQGVTDGRLAERLAKREVDALARQDIKTVQMPPLDPNCTGCGRPVGPGMAGQEDHVDCGPRRLERARGHKGPIDMLGEVLRGIVPHGQVDAETPQRLLGALIEFTSGYAGEITSMMKTFPLEGHAGDPGIVCVRDVPFASLCAHHVLPFTGTASVAYLPSDRIVGLSKIPRLIRIISRRLQTQEFIGEQVADVLMGELVAARGVIVVPRGKHSCMALRGVESPGEMITSCARGVFRDDAAARAEALSLLDMR